jgi:hypothetical protein
VSGPLRLASRYRARQSVGLGAAAVALHQEIICFMFAHDFLDVSRLCMHISGILYVSASFMHISAYRMQNQNCRYLPSASCIATRGKWRIIRWEISCIRLHPGSDIPFWLLVVHHCIEQYVRGHVGRQDDCESAWTGKLFSQTNRQTSEAILR